MKIFYLSNTFPFEQHYPLTDQIRCSSRSVYANLAEAWLTKSEVRSQKSEVVFETEIYTPLPKTMRLKRRGFRPNYFR